MGVDRVGAGTTGNPLRRLPAWLAMVWLVSVPGAASESDGGALWSTWGGSLEIELRADVLPDYGIELRESGRVRRGRVSFRYPVRNLGALQLSAPGGHFERLVDGRLDVSTELELVRGGRRVALDPLVLLPGTDRGHPVLEVHDGHGRHLLTLSHLHVHVYPDIGRFEIRHGDVEATAALAQLLDFPRLAGMPVGSGAVESNLHVPDGFEAADQPLTAAALAEGISCEGRPFWPQDGHEIDVTLIAMDSVAYRGTDPDTGGVKIAPSATLKNESAGDVPWIAKFDEEPQYPFAPADQHPYLVWNLYRIHDGRIEQLAGSGAKHAFNTINVNCTILCTYRNGNILAPGCEDIYSVSTNDDNRYLGPRDEILAAEGLFQSSPSFFDPDGVGFQTNDSGTFENRLLADPEDLETAGAEYFIDAWYVIRHDLDIFNTMGFRRVVPERPNGGWVFPTQGDFVQGPVVSEWVAEDDPGPNAGHRLVTLPGATPNAAYPDNLPRGHLRVLGRVSETEYGYRYHYAVMNYDFDAGIDRFTIPLPPGAQVIETRMGGPGDVLGVPWEAVITAEAVEFTAPPGDFLPWFVLYNFELETDAAPVNGWITARSAEETPDTLYIQLPAPAEGPEEIFADDFAPRDTSS